MATQPEAEPHPPGHELHRARQTAESFGADAERYDRARPSYPAALAELLAGLGAAVDAAGGAFTMGYTTVAVTAARAGPR